MISKHNKQMRARFPRPCFPRVISRSGEGERGREGGCDGARGSILICFPLPCFKNAKQQQNNDTTETKKNGKFLYQKVGRNNTAFFPSRALGCKRGSVCARVSRKERLFVCAYVVVAAQQDEFSPPSLSRFSFAVSCSLTLSLSHCLSGLSLSISLSLFSLSSLSLLSLPLSHFLQRQKSAIEKQKDAFGCRFFFFFPAARRCCCRISTNNDQ